jgi:hypothetical protein
MKACAVECEQNNNSLEGQFRDSEDDNYCIRMSVTANTTESPSNPTTNQNQLFAPQARGLKE